jgi:hypothetical protein
MSSFDISAALGDELPSQSLFVSEYTFKHEQVGHWKFINDIISKDGTNE